MNKIVNRIVALALIITLSGCQLLITSPSTSSSSSASTATTSNSVSSISTNINTDVDSVYYDISNTYTAIYDQLNPSVATVFTYATNTLVDQGSGFVYSAEGATKYVVANYGVIRAKESTTSYAISALRYELLFGNNVRVAATLVGYYAAYEIAVLKFTDTNDSVPVPTIGSFDVMQRGEEVLVIGSPKVGSELRNTLTRGVISGLERMIDSTTDGYTYPAFQIDAPTNSGVFGGPVINGIGEIIGVAQYRIVDEDGISESLSFAIGIDDLNTILDQIIHASNHTYTKVRIGVLVQDIRLMDLAARDDANIPAEVTSGLYVVEAGAGTPAYLAGVRNGDIILTADGHPVSSLSGLSSYLYRKSVGDTFVLSLHDKADANVVLVAVS